MIHLLLDHGAKLIAQDAERRTPLVLAIKSGSLDSVRVLLDHDPSLKLEQLQHREDKGSTVQNVAFYTSHFHIYKYLRNLENEFLEHNPNANPAYNEMLPLALAVESGSLEDVKSLLSRNPELLRKQDSIGQTVLHIAFYEKQREIAEYILEQDVSIETQGYHQWRPLHIASSTGSLTMLSLALTYDADIHAVTATLQTALHKAMSALSIPVLVELLHCGAKPARTNDRGMTALHVAAHQNFVEGAREVLRPEWNPGKKPLVLIKDRRGRTAREWAEASGHLEMAEVLRQEERKAKGKTTRPSLANAPSPSLSRQSTDRTLVSTPSRSSSLLSPKLIPDYLQRRSTTVCEQRRRWPCH